MTTENQRWVVHVVGPDDVIEQPDELTALRYANNTNVVAERDRRSNANDPNWPYIIAVVRNLDNEKITTREYFDSIVKRKRRDFRIHRHARRNDGQATLCRLRISF